MSSETFVKPAERRSQRSGLRVSFVTHTHMLVCSATTPSTLDNLAKCHRSCKEHHRTSCFHSAERTTNSGWSMCGFSLLFFVTNFRSYKKSLFPRPVFKVHPALAPLPRHQPHRHDHRYLPLRAVERTVTTAALPRPLPVTRERSSDPDGEKAIASTLCSSSSVLIHLRRKWR